jgi:hypothetical protein
MKWSTWSGNALGRRRRFSIWTLLDPCTWLKEERGSYMCHHFTTVMWALMEEDDCEHHLYFFLHIFSVPLFSSSSAFQWFSSIVMRSTIISWIVLKMDFDSLSSDILSRSYVYFCNLYYRKLFLPYCRILNLSLDIHDVCISEAREIFCCTFSLRSFHRTVSQNTWKMLGHIYRWHRLH